MERSQVSRNVNISDLSNVNKTLVRWSVDNRQIVSGQKKPNPVEFAPGHSKCLALVRFGLKSEAHLVSQFVTLRTRTHVTVWLVDWVLVIASHCFEVSAIASSVRRL